MIRVLVSGSRDWGWPEVIEDRFGLLFAEHDEVTIAHGAASRKRHGVEVSADMLADRIAHRFGFSVEQFHADWKAEPRRAGIIRNLAMLDTGPDLVLAFQRGESNGTQHTVDEARRRGIPVEVFIA